MTHVLLSNAPGRVALIYDADAERVAARRWRLDRGGYVVTTIKSRPVYLHRLLLSPPDGVEVDHKDGDPLNCQRSNLRLCSRAQNAANVRKFRGRSRYKGVAWRTRGKKWKAQVNRGGRQIHLGYFHSEEAAARAYDREAREQFGEFARLNFPPEAPAA